MRPARYATSGRAPRERWHSPKHTPGPARRQWKLTDLGRLGRDGNEGRLWLNDGEFGMFADAAPELLAALEAFVNPFTGWDETTLRAYDGQLGINGARILNARAAIAKAQGNEVKP